MRKIGVIGAGHLGKIHINCIKEISGYDLVGFYDVNPLVASDVQQKYNIPAFENFEELLEKVDVIDIEMCIRDRGRSRHSWRCCWCYSVSNN